MDRGGGLSYRITLSELPLRPSILLQMLFER